MCRDYGIGTAAILVDCKSQCALKFKAVAVPDCRNRGGAGRIRDVNDLDRVANTFNHYGVKSAVAFIDCNPPRAGKFKAIAVPYRCHRSNLHSRCRKSRVGPSCHCTCRRNGLCVKGAQNQQRPLHLHMEWFSFIKGRKCKAGCKHRKNRDGTRNRSVTLFSSGRHAPDAESFPSIAAAGNRRRLPGGAYSSSL